MRSTGLPLFNPRDQLHAKAISVSTTLQGWSIVTSQMVLTEFLNDYAALGQPFRQRAVGRAQPPGQCRC